MEGEREGGRGEWKDRRREGRMEGEKERGSKKRVKACESDNIPECLHDNTAQLLSSDLQEDMVTDGMCHLLSYPFSLSLPASDIQHQLRISLCVCVCVSHISICLSSSACR